MPLSPRRSQSSMEGRTIRGEPGPAYARRKAVLRNPDVRRSLDRAEARILANPSDVTGRFRYEDGSILDTNEPGLLLAYEETDLETFTWLVWHDLWARGDGLVE